MSCADELLFDPTSLSPDARFRAVASLLATALRRLRDGPPAVAPIPSNLSAESAPNALEECPRKSVTVHGG